MENERENKIRAGFIARTNVQSDCRKYYSLENYLSLAYYGKLDVTRRENYG